MKTFIALVFTALAARVFFNRNDFKFLEFDAVNLNINKKEADKHLM